MWDISCGTFSCGTLIVAGLSCRIGSCGSFSCGTVGFGKGFGNENCVCSVRLLVLELREIAGLPSISNDFPTIREYDII